MESFLDKSQAIIFFLYKTNCLSFLQHLLQAKLLNNHKVLPFLYLIIFLFECTSETLKVLQSKEKPTTNPPCLSLRLPHFLVKTHKRDHNYLHMVIKWHTHLFVYWPRHLQSNVMSCHKHIHCNIIDWWRWHGDWQHNERKSRGFVWLFVPLKATLHHQNIHKVNNIFVTIYLVCVVEKVLFSFQHLFPHWDKIQGQSQ